MPDAPSPAQKVLAKLREEIQVGSKPLKPLGSSNQTALTRFVSGQRSPTEATARKLMAAVWDARYFEGREGAARLKRLEEFLRGLPEGTVPAKVPKAGAKASREAWVTWFAALGAAAETGGSTSDEWPSLALYFEKLRRHFGELTEANVRLLGGTTGELPRLEEVYVSLDADPDWHRDPEGRPEGSGGGEQGAERSERVPALRHLVEHDRLVLLGPPGSGKSTLLKHVCECLAAHAVEPDDGWLGRLSVNPSGEKDEEGDQSKSPTFEWPARLASRVPVFVELRSWIDRLLREKPMPAGEEALESLLKHIEAQLKPLCADSCAPELRRALEQGCGLICLDGLDEVPTEDLKRLVRDTIERLSKPKGSLGGNRIVVTCRTVSYRDPSWQLAGFEARQLCELRTSQIRLFVQRFYAELNVRRGLETESKTEDLLNAIGQRPELRAMAGNPYLLTLMSQLHLRRTLPSGRAELFEEFVRELLIEMESEKWRGTPLGAEGGNVVRTLTSQLKKVQREMGALRQTLSLLAWQTHRAGKGRQGVTLSKDDLVQQLAQLPNDEEYSCEFRERWALEVVELIEHRTGLLVGLGGGRYAMAFKLQEYMTALHFTNGRYFPYIGKDLAGLIDDASGYWEEVVRLAAAHLADVNSGRDFIKGIEIVAELRASVEEMADPAGEVAARRLVVASDIIREIGLGEVQASPLGKDCLKALRAETLRWSQNGALPKPVRAQAAMARGWLGALPSGVGARPFGEDRLQLPDLEWGGEGWAETILPGPFVMGSKDNEGYRYERPQFECSLLRHPYRLGRYPVTVAQFDSFRRAQGYLEEQWWTPEGWRWVQEGQVRGPRGFDVSFQTPNHPQVGVCLHEAIAFARWLNAHRDLLGVPLDWEIRLPTEAEWERAARGTKGGEYPWPGQGGGARDEYNHSGHVGHTSAVDLFPGGRADCGAAEMLGNVWEWTVTEWTGDYTKYPRDEAEKTDWERWVRMNRVSGNDDRVVRGGAWLFLPGRCRAAFRFRLLPEDRSTSLGFRLAASPISGLWSL